MTRSAMIGAATLLVAAALPAALTSAAAAKPATKPRLTASAPAVAESTGKAVVTLTIPAKAKKAVTVRWRTADGTAKAGSDYRAATGTATIKKGKRTAAISIRLVGDAMHETTERFSVRLSSGLATVPARPVTVTVTDDDSEIPSALTGTLTVDTAYDDYPSGTTTLTLNMRLVPTSTAGEWRDDGTGTWTMNGTLTYWPDDCPAPVQTISGSGTFLTGPGDSTTDEATLVLRDFDPATGTGTPSLSWEGLSPFTELGYVLMPPAPPDFVFQCLETPSQGYHDFSIPDPAAAVYTGSPGALHGVTFDYPDPEPGPMSVSGTLTPVG